MSSVITQEIHILKTIFGENIINSVINTIETEIKKAPNKIDGNNSISNALKMFTDLIYSEDGTKRLMSMEQFGSIYICEVFDYLSDKPYVYLAYSLYDIIETFNTDSDAKATYVRLYESDSDDDYDVMIVDYPQNYNDESEDCFNPDDEKALNEIGKYKIEFKNGPCVDVICNPHIISVSNPYVKTTPISIAKSSCASYKFVFDTDLYKYVQICTGGEEDVFINDLFKTIDSDFYKDVLKDKHLFGIKVDGADTLYTMDEAKMLKVSPGKHLVDAIIKDAITVETEFADDPYIFESGVKTVREIFESIDLQRLVDTDKPEEKILDKIIVASTEIENKVYGIDDLVDTDVKIKVVYKDKPEIYVGNTYDFTSYSTETDTLYATGVAKITEINNNANTTTVIVTENSVKDFIGKSFKVNSTSFSAEEHYELYDTENDSDLGMYVIITLKEANIPSTDVNDYVVAELKEKADV